MSKIYPTVSQFKLSRFDWLFLVSPLNIGLERPVVHNITKNLAKMDCTMFTTSWLCEAWVLSFLPRKPIYVEKFSPSVLMSLSYKNVGHQGKIDHMVENWPWFNRKNIGTAQDNQEAMMCGSYLSILGDHPSPVMMKVHRFLIPTKF